MASLASTSVRISIAVALIFPVAAFSQPQDRRITPITVQRKQALIIGNSSYSTAPLKNPANDAGAMDAALRKLGFEVRTLRNLDLPHMEAAIDEFTASLSAGSLAFFYYSGHGIQVNYTNYLLPVDFAASSEIDVKYKAYAATRVQEKMEASGARLRVMVLDACRNNPFRFKRDALGGLASMPVNAEGTLVAFATGDNNTADDNRSEANGLYTKYLIPALQSPGLQLREAFQKAKEDVYAASRKTQNPSIYENIVGAYYLVSPPPASSGGTANSRLDPAAETWDLIKNSTSPEDFESFAKAFPDSPFGAGARIRAAQLRRGAVASAPKVDIPKLPSSSAPVSSVRPDNLEAGVIKVNPKDGLAYVWIPPGTFTMGCSPDEKCLPDSKPAHPVTLTKGFWMGGTEVTQEAYQRVIGTNPSFSKGPKLPVAVTWHEAQAYCQEVGTRLPTEAEWEYAARAGSTGSSNIVIDGSAHEVAQRPANAWGLYDMLGNVYQWTSDWYAPTLTGTNVDPTGPTSGQYKAVRGGSSVTFRGRAEPGFRAGYGNGVRCVGEILELPR
jgi:hypothetical protein